MTLHAEFFERELRRKGERLDTLDHFAVLGVSRLASRADIEAAFSFLVRWFDPERTDALGIPSLHSLARRICDRLRQAFDTLADPDFRAAYELTLASAKSRRTSRHGRVRRRSRRPVTGPSDLPAQRAAND